MRMKENRVDIYKVLTTDETLLRLLYYKPENENDDPLDSTKDDILDMDEEDKWTIIEDRIKKTPKVDDLDKEPKCRLLFYMGRRSKTNNYLYAGQIVVFDVLVHFDFEEVGMRESAICDRVNDLMSNSRVTGIGKVNFEGGDQISAPEAYTGYRLMYSIGSAS